MDTVETRNAIIEGTMLGYEDHGILTAMLILDYGGSGQGFGGYQLDTYRRPGPDNEEDYGGRAAHKACGFLIQRILETVGVEKWEQLKGKHIRVKTTWSKILAIGNILEDKWFEPEKELKALQAEG